MMRSLPCVLLLAGTLAAAPVPKMRKVQPDDVTDAMMELVANTEVQRKLGLTDEEQRTLTEEFARLTSVKIFLQLKHGHGSLDASCPEGLKIAHDERAGRRAAVAAVLTRSQLHRLQQDEF